MKKKKSIRPILLSAFVFPGAGHFVLKKPLIGSLLALTALAALYYLLSKILERAQFIVDEIQRGNVPLDMTAITTLVSQSPTTDVAMMMNVSKVILLIVWIIGIMDVYRIDRCSSSGK